MIECRPVRGIGPGKIIQEGIIGICERFDEPESGPEVSPLIEIYRSSVLRKPRIVSEKVKKTKDKYNI